MWYDLILSGRVPILVRSKITDGWIPVDLSKPSVIISTIPAPAMCHMRTIHNFQSHVIFANGTTREEEIDDNSIVCDGTDEHAWYRIASVFGYRTIEWSRLPPPGTIAANVTKPLYTDCDCYPTVLRVGRYGTWSKGSLVHEVYPAVAEFLEAGQARGWADFLDSRKGPWKM